MFFLVLNARNCKKLNFIFKVCNSVMNNLKCPKSKSLSHCLTELFPIYQNKHWTIRWRDDHTVVPSYHCIILKIVEFLKVPHRPPLNYNDIYVYNNTIIFIPTHVSGSIVLQNICQNYLSYGCFEREHVAPENSFVCYFIRS